VSITIACPDISHHTHVLGKRFIQRNFFLLLCFVSDLFQVFQYLRTFQLNHLTQMNQWNILHANQASVPEATPAPGFERMFMPAHCRVDQLVPSSTAQGKEREALVILNKRTNFQFRHIVADDHYRKRKKCHVFLEILSRYVLYFSYRQHSSHVLHGTLDERRGRIW